MIWNSWSRKGNCAIVRASSAAYAGRKRSNRTAGNHLAECLEPRFLLASTPPLFSSLQSLTVGIGKQPYSSLVRDSSGNLYGTTEGGGNYYDGSVFELSGTNYSTYTTLVSFTGATGNFPGSSPEASLIIDGSGNLYGTTEVGGASNDGTVFELAANHTTFTSLASFTGNTGTNPGQDPSSSLALDTSGNLYGTTEYGGTYDDGTIFELAANHITFTSLASFLQNSGSYPGLAPLGGLVLDSSGNLYGTTANGGNSNDGTVFELAANHTTFTRLVSFTGTTGSDPGLDADSGLIMDSSGNLYGVTDAGGASNDGTVFELAANHTTFTSLVSFTGTSGNYPGLEAYASLAMDSSGDLFGTTESGGATSDGTVFELAANHTTFTSLISFTGNAGSNPGINVEGGLVLDSSGNLYGTTRGGGTYADGTVFMLPVSNRNALTTLFTFNGGNGIAPSAALAIDSAGNLYGTTQYGGLYYDGSIFELSGTNYSTETTLVSFSGTTGGDLGMYPFGNLILDSSGNLYGTTDAGGTANDGTVFELAANHSTFTSLISFTGTTGTYLGTHPYNGLTLDGSGNLYGTTNQGGTANDGTIFELAANHTSFTSLVSFTGSGNYIGENPRGTLTLDSSGDLFGTTWSSGTTYDGTIFELAANHTTFATLISFTGNLGNYPGNEPVAGLTFDSAGNLYGTTEQGGASNDGTAFELAANLTTFTSLVSFTGSSGSYPGNYPSGSLTLDIAGNLYGTTQVGGAANDGSVFELAANRTTFTSLISFTGNTGSYPGTGPLPGLIIDSSGNLYGTTEVGGTYGLGSVFEVSTAAIPTQLAFTSAPTNTVAGSTINPPTGVVVALENEYGQPITTSNDSIVLTTGSNPTGANLSGTLTATTVNGVANFSNLSINAIGAEYTLVATDNTNLTLSPVTSAAFSIGSATTSITAGTTLKLTSSSSGHSVLVTGSLTIAGTSNASTGKLDVTNNDVDVISGSLATITNQVAVGYSRGSWLGEGITSSTAAADSTHLTALGVIQNNQSGTALYSSTNPLDGTTPGTGDILVKYTYNGDANLDGKVDGSDYSLIDNGYAKHLTGWYNGDFNYDGVVNGSDYTLIDNAFNQQGASLAAVAAPAAQIAPALRPVQKPAALFSQAVIAPQYNGMPVIWTTAPASVAAALFGSDSDQRLIPRKLAQIMARQ